MAEYIERGAIMEMFAAYVKRSNNSDFAPTPTWNQAVQIVEDAPAADVAPVRRGRWIKKKQDDGWGEYEIYCHEDCGCLSASERNYCPDCGARMVYP